MQPCYSEPTLVLMLKGLKKIRKMNFRVRLSTGGEAFTCENIAHHNFCFVGMESYLLVYHGNPSYIIRICHYLFISTDFFLN